MKWYIYRKRGVLALLGNILDLTKDSFHWKYHNSANYEIYVIRTGKNVKVSKESETQRN
jgi:hypothetical protein